MVKQFQRDLMRSYGQQKKTTLNIKKMKSIVVIAQYEAYVPDDMTVSQIQDLVQHIIENQLDCFSVYVEQYPDENESSPLFELKSVMVGTNSIIAVGGE